MMPRPLRILHLTAGSDAGGVSRYICDLAVAMGKLGHEVEVAGQRGVWHDHFEEAGVRWIDARLKAGWPGLWAESRSLAEHLRQHPVDVLHVHYRKAALVGRMVQRRIHSRTGQRVPLLYTLHLTDMPMGFPWRWLSDFGDHCHAPSIAAKRWLMRVARVPEERITLIPHGIDPGRFPLAEASIRSEARGLLGLGENQVVVAYVGRLEDPKNEGWCIDVAEQMRNRRSEVGETVLLIAGDGPNRAALERRIAELGLRDCVRLLGECDPVPVYQAADALLLPSSREGFSYVCAEAMSCGVPVLRTRTAGTEEMIIEGVTGRSCEIYREAFIAAAIEMIGLPRARLREMGQAAAAHVRSHLTFDRQVEQTLHLYQSLAATDQTGR